MAWRARQRLAWAFVVGGLAVAALVWLWSSRPPVSPPALVLVRVEVAQLPGWRARDPRAALAAYRRSCAHFLRQVPATVLGGAGYGGTIADWRAVCAAAPADNLAPDAARSYFETRFTAFEIVSHGSAQSLFTGYYEPELRVSRSRHGPFASPIYGLPGDLITVDLGRFRNLPKRDEIVGRLADHQLVPYYTREEIDAHGLSSAPVLAYADDPVAVFFLQIQGSGRAVLDNGEVVRLVYAGQNGRPYTPIGRTLIEKGAIPAERMSMQAIRQWLLGHPADARTVMESDQSFVFFREATLGDPRLGSPGTEGAPLTPMASIAVDDHVHPLGIPFFIAATAPNPDSSRPDEPLDGIFVAQDTGGAIRGAGRADVFWGFGPAAQSIAGRMKSTGRLYVLLPNGLASRVQRTKFTLP